MIMWQFEIKYNDLNVGKSYNNIVKSYIYIYLGSGRFNHPCHWKSLLWISLAPKSSLAIVIRKNPNKPNWF